jgi:hypothetical protein
MTRLVPREGERYLSPMEVITRVQAEFAYVEASEEGALDYEVLGPERVEVEGGTEDYATPAYAAAA